MGTKIREPLVNELGELIRGIVILVLNQKGGCGKTISVESLAALAAACDKLRCLMLDLDPQANLTRRLEGDFPPERHIANALLGKDQMGKQWKVEHFLKSAFECKVMSILKPLDLVPGTADFETALLVLGRLSASYQPTQRLFKALDFQKAYYNYTFIDTPPRAEGMVVDLSMEAADVLLVPIDGLDALDGLCNILETSLAAQAVARRGVRPMVKVFLYSPHLTGPAWNNPDRCAWFQLMLELFPRHTAKTPVKHHPTIANSAYRGEVIYGMGPGPREQYRELYEELFKTLIPDPTLPPLTEWMAQQGLTVEHVRGCVQSLRDAAQRSVVCSPVSYHLTNRSPRVGVKKASTPKKAAAPKAAPAKKANPWNDPVKRQKMVDGIRKSHQDKAKAKSAAKPVSPPLLNELEVLIGANAPWILAPKK